VSNVLTYNKKFKPLFDLPSGVRYYIVTGGRFSSKSYSVSTAVCTHVNNENRKALYSRYTLTSAKDSIIPEFAEKIDLLGIGDWYESKVDRIVGPKNREVVFKGLRTSAGNQTAKLKSLKGFSIFVLDEAEEENDEQSFDRINLSIRELGPQNIVVLILNPCTKEHWIYKRFFESMGVQAGFNGVKENVCYIHTTYLDVIEHVPADYINEIEILKRNNPKKYDHVIMGGWLDAAEGVVFDNWEYGAFDDSLPHGYGLDFGFFPDPDCLIKVAIDHKRKIIYCKQEFRINNAGVDTLALKIKQHSIAGLTIFADSKENRLIPDLKGRGVTGIKECIKGPGSVLSGIKLMQDFKIIVDPSSTDIGAEFNNYVWSDKKSGVPIDAYNHAIDAIRYYVQSIIKPKPTKGQRVI
jgi:phage terminase large subunit